MKARMLLAATLLLAAVAAPEATAAQLEVRTFQRPVQAADLERFTIGCPLGTVALTGGFRNLPPTAAKVSGSIPENGTSWTFTVDTRTSPASVTTTVFLSCLRVPPRPRGYSVQLAPTTVKLPVRLEASQTATLTLGCPAGQRPTGYGLQSSGGQQPGPAIASVGGVGDVNVIKAKPVGRNVELSLSNSGESADLTAGAQCAPRAATARLRPGRRGRRGRKTLSWGFRGVLQSGPETLGTGDNNNRRRRCNPHRRGKRSVGSKAVSAWHELPSGSRPVVYTSYPVGRDGVWNIFSSAPGQATLEVLCLSAATRWR